MMAGSAVRPDAFARLVGRTGRFVASHPQLARACVPLLMRAPGRELEVRDASGHLQRIDTRDQMGANLLLGRYRLPAGVARGIAAGGWAVDVGANIGVITSQLCQVVGNRGLVWAFEPLPGNVERLSFLKERNGLDQLTLFPVAVGAEEGTAAIGLPPPGRSGWGSITKSWDVAGRLEVPVRPLDAVVGAAGGDRRISFLKIDVEGFEPEVLEGARQVLAEHRPDVFCEFNDVLLRDRGSSSQLLLDQFATLGYRPAGGERAPSLARNLANRVVNLLLTHRAPGG